LSEDVILTGSRTDVPALLSGMDALLLPSFFEGAPVSVIEAQTSGLPCVLSDAVTRDVGFYDAEYVSLRKPSARWTEAVLNKADERRDRSEAAGEAKKAGFEISAEAKKLEKYYMDLI
jgi:glycosyltransferase involved in cell wall biosynthesis